jgi:RimJ/RimL family protein N-acetyltransferase
MHLWPTTYPILESERLIFSRLVYEDLNSLVEKCNHKEISIQTNNLPYPYTYKYALGRLDFLNTLFEQEKGIVWCVKVKSTLDFAGEIGLHWREESSSFEVGYWFAKELWGMGYATESLKRILEYGFEEMGTQRIFGTYFTDNLGSLKVMKKAGMRFEKELPPKKNQDGIYKGLGMCSSVTGDL